MTNKKRKLLYIRSKNAIRTLQAKVFQQYKFSDILLKDDPSVIETEEREAKSKAERFWHLSLKLVNTQMGKVGMDFAHDMTTVNFVYEHSRN